MLTDINPPVPIKQDLMGQATGQQPWPRYSHSWETKHCVIVQKKNPTTISNCVMLPHTKLSHNALPHVTVCMAHVYTPFKHTQIPYSCFWHPQRPGKIRIGSKGVNMTQSEAWDHSETSNHLWPDVKQETETKAFFSLKATALHCSSEHANTLTTVHVHTARLKRTRGLKRNHTYMQKQSECFSSRFHCCFFLRFQ